MAFNTELHGVDGKGSVNLHSIGSISTKTWHNQIAEGLLCGGAERLVWYLQFTNTHCCNNAPVA